MLGTAEEEIKKSDEIWNSTSVEALRSQQEKDFGLWGPYEFKMPKKEGNWDDVTTNSPKILANKILGLLSSSWLQLFIDVPPEKEETTRADRKKISNTEYLANGNIWLSDRLTTRVPSGKKLQSALATHAVIRGGTVKSVYWYTDKDKFTCDIKTYDPLYSQWIEGDGELLWFCYRNYVTKQFLEQKFGNKIKKGFKVGDADNYGRVLTHLLWDKQQWKLAVNKGYLDEGSHELGYIPVNVRSCGAIPYLQSETYHDTMKYSWVSCFANNRDIYDLESKMLSIESSKATESGKIKIAGEWDSMKSGGVLPKGIEKMGYSSGTRNEIVMFDAAKGQRFGGMVQPPDNQVVDQFLTRIRGMDIIGSIDPIAFGQMTRSGSGALAAELRGAALEFINPFRECVEDDFKWVAEEIVSQFKNGEYESVLMEGKDSKKHKFYIDLAPKDVEERHFDCNLVPDRLRDELQEIGAAIQKVSYGLSSRKTAMLDHNIHEDPDMEMENIEQEKHAEIASADPVMHNQELAKYYEDKGNIEMALYHMTLAKVAIEASIRGIIAGEEESLPEERKPSIVSPQMDNMNMALQPQKQ